MKQQIVKGFIMLKKNVVNLACVFFACAALSFMGCGGSEKGLRLGEKVPENVLVVKLADVLAAPADYNGQKIVLEGIVLTQCPSLCFFNYQEGPQNVTFYPKGFELPKLELGKSVTVYAEVIKGEGQVVFSLLGLEME